MATQYSLEQLYTALEAADKAGNTQDAKSIAQMIQQTEQQQPAQQQDTGVIGTVADYATGLAYGAKKPIEGFADLVADATGVDVSRLSDVGLFYGPEGITFTRPEGVTSYPEQIGSYIDKRYAQAERTSPTATGIGEFVGEAATLLAPATGATKAATALGATSLPARAATQAAIGGGLAFGTTETEDEEAFSPERIRNAAIASLFGAGGEFAGAGIAKGVEKAAQSSLARAAQIKGKEALEQLSGSEPIRTQLGQFGSADAVSLRRGARELGGLLEDVPFIGTGGARRETSTQVADALRTITGDVTGEAIATAPKIPRVSGVFPSEVLPQALPAARAQIQSTLEKGAIKSGNELASVVSRKVISGYGTNIPDTPTIAADTLSALRDIYQPQAAKYYTNSLLTSTRLPGSAINAGTTRTLENITAVLDDVMDPVTAAKALTKLDDAIGASKLSDPQLHDGLKIVKQGFLDDLKIAGNRLKSEYGTTKGIAINTKIKTVAKQLDQANQILNSGPFKGTTTSDKFMNALLTDEGTKAYTEIMRRVPATQRKATNTAITSKYLTDALDQATDANGILDITKVVSTLEKGNPNITRIVGSDSEVVPALKGITEYLKTVSRDPRIQGGDSVSRIIKAGTVTAGVAGGAIVNPYTLLGAMSYKGLNAKPIVKLLSAYGKATDKGRTKLEPAITKAFEKYGSEMSALGTTGGIMASPEILKPTEEPDISYKYPLEQRNRDRNILYNQTLSQ